MAEDNPKIEINIPKKIINPRERFFSENKINNKIIHKKKLNKSLISNKSLNNSPTHSPKNNNLPLITKKIKKSESQIDIHKNKLNLTLNSNILGIVSPKIDKKPPISIREKNAIFSRLRFLNKNSKKNSSVKTYFKGLESVFINPEQIYPVIQKSKNNNDSIKKNSKIYFSSENENNEYFDEHQEDQKQLQQEKNELNSIMNSNKFFNFLNNRNFFFGSKNKNKEILPENDIKLQYLKKISFNHENTNNINLRDMYNFLNKKDDSDSKINNKNTTINDNSKNELNDIVLDKRKLEEEKEEKVKINGKTYIMKNQMEDIAKEILHKCKVYNVLNSNNN